MRFSTGSVLGVCALAAALLPLIAYQDPAPAPRHVADPFAAGWMLADTNGDSIVDFIQGKIVVPANPAAEQNAAAADLAARLGYATTGFTPVAALAGSTLPR